MRSACVWAAVVLACTVAVPVWAQLKPAGSEFQVNTYTTGDQPYFGGQVINGPAICCDAAGNFVVVWASFDQDGDNDGIFAQRYSNSGAPRGTEFQVNTYTTSRQDRPAVNCDPMGNFVVVWQSLDQDGNGSGVFGQRYDSAAVAQGTEFQVNTYTTDLQGYPAVSCDTAGNFVVVWQSYNQDG